MVDAIPFRLAIAPTRLGLTTVLTGIMRGQRVQRALTAFIWIIHKQEREKRMKRRELLAGGAGMVAMALAGYVNAEHYLRIPYTPEAYEQALTASEPVLFTFYATW